MLANTAVHQPAGAAAPSLIRLARTPALRHAVCGATPMFVRATTALSRPALPAAVRDAYAAPYATADRRRAVEEFVADIPLEPGHVSAATLDEIAEEVRKLDDVPALLLWGPRDPVFSDRYLRDLRARLPHADVQRYERASHLVVEDAPEAATDAWAWIGEHVPDRHRGSDLRERPAPAESAPDLWTALESRAGGPLPRRRGTAGGGRSISWDLLVRRVHELAAGFAEHGVAPGDRVALLVPPGAELTAAAHACWRAGASVVVADPGLGAAGLARALRGAHPAHVVGALPGLALAAALGIPGSRIATGPVPPGLRRVLGSPVGLAALARRGRALLDAWRGAPGRGRAGGRGRGAVHLRRHRSGEGRRLPAPAGRAQLAALRAAYGITEDDRLVAAFPPFALYGPALGIPSAVPEVRKPPAPSPPRRWRAPSPPSTRRWSSPPPPRSAPSSPPPPGSTPTQRGALAGVRRVVSAGAPVPAALLHALRGVLPNAAAHTPYGMTEALPVTDVALAEIDAAGPGNGVCVGRPLPGVDVAVIPLTTGGGSSPASPASPARSASPPPHVKDRYDQLWAVQRRSAREAGRHRTGDVGHLDAEGRLWVEGRLVHVVDTAAGPVTPVGIEQRVEAIDGIAVGGGRRGRAGGDAAGGGRRGRRAGDRGPAHRGTAAGRRSADERGPRGRGGLGGGGAGRRRPARRHPARGEDRPHAGGGVGGPGAGGRAGGAAPVTRPRAHRGAPVHTPAARAHRGAPVHIARGMHEPGGVCTGGNRAGEPSRRAANGWTP